MQCVPTKERNRSSMQFAALHSRPTTTHGVTEVRVRVVSDTSYHSAWYLLVRNNGVHAVRDPKKTEPYKCGYQARDSQCHQQERHEEQRHETLVGLMERGDSESCPYRDLPHIVDEEELCLIIIALIATAKASILHAGRTAMELAGAGHEDADRGGDQHEHMHGADALHCFLRATRAQKVFDVELQV